jgi:ATP-binding cassette subfamily F protein uup
LVVTHDRAFLDRVATSILAFEQGAAGVPAVTRYAGGYQDYILQRGEQALPSSAPLAAPKPVASARPRGGLSFAERAELETILDAIDAAEKKVTLVESLLSDPSLYASRGQEVKGLQAQLEAARTHAAALVSRWEALEAKKG